MNYDAPLRNCGRHTHHDIPSLMQIGMRLREDQPIEAPKTLDDHSEIQKLAACLLWRKSGFPAVELGHRLAAALICTQAQETFRPPWEAFLVYPPSDLITLSWPGQTPYAIGHILTAFSSTDWYIFMASVGGTRGCYFAGEVGQVISNARIARCIGTPPDLDAVEVDESMYLDRADQPPIQRALDSVVRLIANTCAALAEPRHVQRIGKGHAPDPFARPAPRPVLEAKTQLFRLGTPVRVDCRESVAEYMRGARRGLPSVRWLVRGHWTHQAHGPERSLRRLQWIEPYWKGPDDAPINVRPHVLAEAQS